MKLLRLFPDQPKLHFVRYRHIAVGLSIAVILAAFVLLFTRGLNFGIDFKGGIAMEVTTSGPADVSGLREQLGGLNLGEVTIQQFGAADDVLIRVSQPKDAPEGTDQIIVGKIKAALGDKVQYQKVDIVGPQVSGELVNQGVIAVVLAVCLMFVYIAFRFEWQFGLGAVLGLAHDVLATVFVFSVFQLEFDLTTIAALLTIIGYSMNDKVVVFDRMRENLRKYKKMDLGEVIDLSVNETLSRTLMTALTTLIALVSLFVFGGEVVRIFTFTMIFGVFVGTYSSIYIGAPVLMAIGVKRDWSGNAKKPAADAAKPAKSPKKA
ncbi:MAG: protein translocase subunit SecF [Parvibaculaceae bacterium]|nr:protein translocase subunit SecF [Parvibaculaceae bacterium]